MIRGTLVAITLSASLLSFQPTILASSKPWTITTHYHETDEVHYKPHKGMDFALPIGTPIASITDGEVIMVKDEGHISFGKSVRIRDNFGRVLIYGHLSKPLVKVGDRVKFGQHIGLSGNTGHSTGPHLHFQVNINGKEVDPRPTITGAMVRKALLGGENSEGHDNIQSRSTYPSGGDTFR